MMFDPLKRIINQILVLVGFSPKQQGLATDEERFNVRIYSRLLNNNEAIIYSTPKLKLQGRFIRGNPDGSEDLVKLSPTGYEFIESLRGPEKESSLISWPKRVATVSSLMLDIVTLIVLSLPSKRRD
ncbi:hypothetical protein [Hymenobacter volaticus]|uniref:Uncharacterized protein n=1 Tax=Hymenobacter volaticus TaxID=2932254 RepID=A0ABY4GFJ1_9BACT|nr:hypothetical protein [Hymenobacter volaticus]UOQ69575.1 hypothetical protein MUN86_28460 [Hymenobacter volaticus]